MASDQKTVDYITEQMSAAGSVRSRKMFGEYAVYCDDKVVALVCDNQLFLKITDPGSALLKDHTKGNAYPGAKESFVVGAEYWDNAEYMASIAKATADALPIPKKK